MKTVSVNKMIGIDATVCKPSSAKGKITMKKIIILALVFACHCGSKVSVELTFDGAAIDSCAAAEIKKLSPGDGGFRFLCDARKSIYVTYDTSDAKDGTIKSVSLQSDTQQKEFLPAVYSSARGTEKCASAKALARKSGEAPFATDMAGNPKHGSYELAMAKPCGNLTIKIAAAQ